jgi:hypothetical protein
VRERGLNTEKIERIEYWGVQDFCPAWLIDETAAGKEAVNDVLYRLSWERLPGCHLPLFAVGIESFLGFRGVIDS